MSMGSTFLEAVISQPLNHPNVGYLILVKNAQLLLM
jgi:hypothetical protein